MLLIVLWFGFAVATLAVSTSVESWENWAKFLLGLIVGLFVVSGGLFAFAWAVSQKVRRQWFELAAEWSKSDSFRTAINDARRELTERLILEMHNEIDRRIDVHDGRDNLEAHRAAMIHVFRNQVANAIGSMGLERDIRELRERLEKLERRRERQA